MSFSSKSPMRNCCFWASCTWPDRSTSGAIGKSTMAEGENGRRTRTATQPSVAPPTAGKTDQGVLHLVDIQDRHSICLDRGPEVRVTKWCLCGDHDILMLVACKISHVAAAQPRVGERPSVSWLVEALVDNPTRRAPADPTLLAGVGESDRWLVRVRAETTPGQQNPGDCGRGLGGGRKGRAPPWVQPPGW
jgi:hypothetical protein